LNNSVDNCLKCKQEKVTGGSPIGTLKEKDYIQNEAYINHDSSDATSSSDHNDRFKCTKENESGWFKGCNILRE